MQVYYQYIGIPKKQRNPSYQKFKLEHLPFSWDTIARNIDEDMLDNDQPQGITPNEWLERIKQLTESSVTENVVTDNELLNLETKLKS